MVLSLKLLHCIDIDDLRDGPKGNLPAYAWPGGYPMIYIRRDGKAVCPKCANRPVDSLQEVVGGDVYWEGPDLSCEECGEAIPSAYGGRS